MVFIVVIVALANASPNKKPVTKATQPQPTPLRATAPKSQSCVDKQHDVCKKVEGRIRMADGSIGKCQCSCHPEEVLSAYCSNLDKHRNCSGSVSTPDGTKPCKCSCHAA